MTGIRQRNSDIFIEEDFLFSALSIRQRQDKKPKSKILEVSVSNSKDSSHSSISRLNAELSTSKTNVYHLIPGDIRPFPKRTPNSKSKVSANFTHFPVMDIFTETKIKP